MTVPNNSSRQVWAYEGTPNSPAITAAGSTSYYFGLQDGEETEWQTIHPELNVQEYYNYAQRMPMGFSKLDPMYPDFPVEYCPTTAQGFARFLGDNATNGVETHDPLDAGQTYPITYRQELRGGTTEQVFQAVGCYTVGLDIIGRIGNALKIAETLAWGYLEDQGDRAVLTTAPTAAGGLTSPVAYDGRPYFEWNTTQLTEAVSVRFSQQQNYHKSYNPATGKFQVYKDSYKPAQLIIEAILDAAIGYTMWDDYVDRNSRNAVLKFYKPDMTNYWQIDLTGCHIIKFVGKGRKNQGHYLSTISIIAGSDISGSSNFLNEGANFSTHFKGVVS